MTSNDLKKKFINERVKSFLLKYDLRTFGGVSNLTPFFEFFFQNCVDGKFFENFSWVLPRSTNQDASIQLLFVKFCSVGASGKKFPSK